MIKGMDGSSRRTAGERESARRGNRRRVERVFRKDYGGGLRNQENDRGGCQRRRSGQLADRAMCRIVFHRRHVTGALSTVFRVRFVRTRRTRIIGVPLSQMDRRGKNHRPDEKGDSKNVQSLGHA